MTAASEELLRLFIDQAPVPIAMFDREMRYIAASRRWVTDYGLVGMNWRDVSHYEVFPDLPDRWRAIHRRALHGEVVTHQAVAPVLVMRGSKGSAWNAMQREGGMGEEELVANLMRKGLLKGVGVAGVAGGRAAQDDGAASPGA